MRLDLLIRIGLLGSLLGVAGPPALADNGRTIRLNVEIANTGPSSLDAGAISIALPLCAQSVQCVRDDRQAPLTCELTTSTWSPDAPAVRLLTPLRPYERMAATIAASCPQADVTTGTPESALGASPGIAPEDPAIIAVADVFDARASAAERVATLMAIVPERIRYTGYRARTLSASDALHQGVGDCTEYALLLAALSRAQGIPAHLVAGYVLDAGALAVDPAAYHNWVEFHDGERWQVADPLYGVIGAGAEGYVAFFRFGAADALDDGHRRFSVTEPGIQVRLR